VRFPKGYADAVARLRVPCGFVLTIALLLLSKPTSISLAVGLPVSILGLAIRAWAAGHLEKDATLAESGPYGWVRNPLYLGTLVVASGLAIASRKWEMGVLFAAVFLLIYLPAVELEEQHLRALFASYDDYAQRVPRLVPRWPSGRIPKKFRRELYRRNREYQALLGFLAGATLLIWKATAC